MLEIMDCPGFVVLSPYVGVSWLDSSHTLAFNLLLQLAAPHPSVHVQFVKQLPRICEGE